MMLLSKQDLKITLALVNGRIYGGGNLAKTSEALGIARDIIALLGGNRKVLAVCDDATRIIDLHGRAVIPGFIDAHTHFIQMGVNSLHLDLSKTKSLATLLEQVGMRCAQLSNVAWVLGSGWV
jgi:predicted amidohydrolase YtcJ